MIIKNKDGLTFIEVLIAMSIVVPVILILISADVSLMRNAEDAKETMIALQDLNSVIAQIRNLSETSLGTVTSTHSSGSTVSGYSNLTSETLTITYPSASDDPLDITVTVTWQNRWGRTRTKSMSVKVTQR